MLSLLIATMLDKMFHESLAKVIDQHHPIRGYQNHNGDTDTINRTCIKWVHGVVLIQHLAVFITEAAVGNSIKLNIVEIFSVQQKSSVSLWSEWQETLRQACKWSDCHWIGPILIPLLRNFENAPVAVIQWAKQSSACRFTRPVRSRVRPASVALKYSSSVCLSLLTHSRTKWTRNGIRKDADSSRKPKESPR